MRRYETIFIIDPDVSEEQRGSIFERLEELVTRYKGFQVARDEWGMKKLAYDIRKRTRGYYILMDYCGDGALVDEIERSFRIDDKVLKFMTIVLDKNVDLAQIKEDLEKAAEEAKAASESPAADTSAAESDTPAAPDAPAAAAAENVTTEPEEKKEEA